MAQSMIVFALSGAPRYYGAMPGPSGDPLIKALAKDYHMPIADPSAPLLYRIPVVAERLDQSVPTVKRLIASGVLKKVKVGRSVRVRASDLEAYVNSLTDDPTPIRKSN